MLPDPERSAAGGSSRPAGGRSCQRAASLHRTPTSLPPAGAPLACHERGPPRSKEGRAPPACGVGLAVRDGTMASPRDCIEFAKQCAHLADLCEDDPQLREHPKLGCWSFSYRLGTQCLRLKGTPKPVLDRLSDAL